MFLTRLTWPLHVSQKKIVDKNDDVIFTGGKTEKRLFLKKNGFEFLSDIFLVQALLRNDGNNDNEDLGAEALATYPILSSHSFSTRSGRIMLMLCC